MSGIIGIILGNVNYYCTRIQICHIGKKYFNLQNKINRILEDSGMALGSSL